MRIRTPSGTYFGRHHTEHRTRGPEPCRRSSAGLVKSLPAPARGALAERQSDHFTKIGEVNEAAQFLDGEAVGDELAIPPEAENLALAARRGRDLVAVRADPARLHSGT